MEKTGDSSDYQAVGPIPGETAGDNERSQRIRTESGKSRRSLFAFARSLACLIPIIMPVIHLLIFKHLWGHLKKPVDVRKCGCSCWDAIFKGPYETGLPIYKNVYFNLTESTLKMWTITVMWVIFMYEAFKHLFRLLFLKKLRWTMGLLFLSSLHSHYYAWWSHWNYWNDGFYTMWHHQVFFTFTELASSLIVLKCMDVRRPIEPLPMLIVCNIACFHIMCTCWDQFVFTVAQGHGQLHQVLRDIPFMATDVVHAVLSLYELRGYCIKSGVTLSSFLLQRHYRVLVAYMTTAMFIAVIVFPSDK